MLELGQPGAGGRGERRHVRLGQVEGDDDGRYEPELGRDRPGLPGGAKYYGADVIGLEVVPFDDVGGFSCSGVGSQAPRVRPLG